MSLAQHESSHTDIFTDLDDSIFSDGSIDPLGLRMIWTSLGNAIFKNKLNTVSTSIKFYTLNLFHHSVIREVQQQYPEIFLNHTGKAPYHTKTDLYDGLIIFLECLMAHVLVQERQWASAESNSDFFIPGLSKLKGKIDNGVSEQITVSIPVSKNEGILVRHILLGIHGRHKGPFQQMGLLNRFDYYSNGRLWDEVRTLFKAPGWYRLHQRLCKVLRENVLSLRISGNKPIWVKASDALIDQSLLTLYRGVLHDDSFRLPSLISFWERYLGLSAAGDTASLIYDVVKSEKGEASAEEIIQELSEASGKEEFAAICAIEPFISLHNKVMNRLLSRGTVQFDEELKQFVRRKLSDPSINTSVIHQFLNERFFNAEAIRRLQELITLFEQSNHPVNEFQYITELIAFHHRVMKQRGNIPWISVGPSGDITQHRSFFYTDQYLQFLEGNVWMNDYYVGTVNSLYKGLYAS
jgi:hypothetical protein